MPSDGWVGRERAGEIHPGFISFPGCDKPWVRPSPTFCYTRPSFRARPSATSVDFILRLDCGTRLENSSERPRQSESGPSISLRKLAGHTLCVLKENILHLLASSPRTGKAALKTMSDSVNYAGGGLTLCVPCSTLIGSHTYLC